MVSCISSVPLVNISYIGKRQVISEFDGNSTQGIDTNYFIHSQSTTITQPVYKLEKRNMTMVEYAITCDTITKRTAYDLVKENSIAGLELNGGMIMREFNLSDKKAFLQIQSTYEKSIKFFSVFIGLLVIIAVVNPPFLPRAVSVAGIIMFLVGIFGLNINKILWEGKDK